MREEPLGLYCYDTDLDVDFNELIGNVKKKPMVSAGVRRGSVMAPAKVAVALPDSSGKPKTRDRADSNVNAASVKNSKDRSSGGSKDRVSPNNTVSTRTGGKIQMTDVEAAISANNDANPDDTSPTVIVKPYEESAWVDDIEVVELRHAVDDKFRAIWSEGIAAYVNGDWQKARDVFQETMKLSDNADGPSKYLISVIDNNQGKAPDNWPGYKDES